MKKLITIALLLTIVSACAEGAERLNVSGLTADCYGCIHSLDGYECDHTDEAFSTELGSITTDLDGDGAEETLSIYPVIDQVFQTWNDEYVQERVLRLSITDDPDSEPIESDMPISYDDLYSHTGAFTQAEPAGGELKAYTRAYLICDTPYIVIEDYENAFLCGDGRGYSVYIYRYNGSTLETVAECSNAGSDPYVLDADLIQQLAGIGVGSIDLEQMWLGNGLLSSIKEPIVPIAGAFVNEIEPKDEFDYIGYCTVRDHYEETGESQIKAGTIHVLSAEELQTDMFRTSFPPEDGWFSFNAEFYARGTLTASGDVSVRELPSEDSAQKRALSAGDTVYYGGFSVTDSAGNPWYCAIYDSTYGFIPESAVTLSED